MFFWQLAQPHCWGYIIGNLITARRMHAPSDMPMLLRALLLASAHTVLVDAAAAPTKKRVMVWTTEDAANTK